MIRKLRNRYQAARQNKRMEAALKAQHQAKADRAWDRFYRACRILDLLPEEMDYVLQRLDPHHKIKKGGCGYCGVIVEELERYGYFPCAAALWYRDLSGTLREIRRNVKLNPDIAIGCVSVRR
jgi:hypothetical protein